MIKKTLSAFLAATLLTACIPMAANAAEGLPVNENFEGISNVNGLKWNRKEYLSLTDGKGGGTAIRLSTASNEDGSTYSGYTLDEPIRSGAVKISYSFKPGEDISTMFRIKDSNGNDYCPTFISPEGILTIGRGNATETAELYNSIYRRNCELNIWYDVECIIDLDDQTARVSVTDEKGNKVSTRLLKVDEYTNSGLVMQDIASIMIQVWSKKNCSSAFDNIKLDEEAITFKLESDNTGNVFGTEEYPEFDVTIKNSSSSKYAGEIDWQVYSSDGKLADRGSENWQTAKGTTMLTISPNVEKNDIYKLTCNVIGDKTTGKSNPISKTETTEFTKILSSLPDEKNEFFGFATHLIRWGEAEESIDLMNKIGSSGWRDEKSWASTENVKGEYNFDDNWQAMINKAKTKDTNNVMVLAFGNTVYQDSLPEKDRDTLRIPTREEDIQAFAEYCRYIVQNTKDVVDCYEIWNEYDGGFNRGTTNKNDSNYSTRGNTDDYIKILKAAHDVIRHEAPNAKIIGLGGAGLQFNLGKTFVKEFFEKGGYNYCDALSVHPYDRTTYFPNAYWVDMQEELKWYMNLYGVDMPVYITEMGRSTALESPTQENHPVADEESLALEVVKANAFARAKDLADRIYWYDFMDDGDDISEEESCFGIVSWNRNQEKGGFFPKPAFVSIAAMNNLMSGNIRSTDMYIEETVKSDSTATDHHNGLMNYKFGAYCFDRVDKGDKIVVMWNDLTKASTTLNLGCESVDVYDVYGNKTETMNSSTGIYRVDASDTVIYLVGDINKLEYGESEISEIQKGITITTDKTKRTVTVSGKVLNSAEDEVATVIVVEKGNEVIPKNILYINEIRLENSEFSHTMKIPKCDSGSFDIYLGATNAYSVKTDGTESAWSKVISVTVDESQSDKVTGSVKLVNHDAEPKKVQVILTQYSSDNRMVSVKIKEVEIPANTDNAIEEILTYDKHKDAEKFVCCVWDSFNGMKPLY